MQKVSYEITFCWFRNANYQNRCCTQEALAELGFCLVSLHSGSTPSSSYSSSSPQHLLVLDIVLTASVQCQRCFRHFFLFFLSHVGSVSVVVFLVPLQWWALGVVAPSLAEWDVCCVCCPFLQTPPRMSLAQCIISPRYLFCRFFSAFWVTFLGLVTKKHGACCTCCKMSFSGLIFPC